jgi:hypothetical protein
VTKHKALLVPKCIDIFAAIVFIGVTWHAIEKGFKNSHFKCNMEYTKLNTVK